MNYFKGLSNIMPVLRQFYLTVRTYNDREFNNIDRFPIYCVLKSLIDDLWIVSEKLQQLTITIQCCSKYAIRIQGYETSFPSDCEAMSATIYGHTGARFQIQNIETKPSCYQLQMTISKH
jgi:hypothetical protein